MEFRVHWLSLTLWAEKDYALKMWDEWFEEYLGQLNPVGHGGRGFGSLFQALAAAKLYADPLHQNDGVSYVHFEFPGTSCDALPDKLIQEFIVTLNRWEKYRVTRVDLAWDRVEFTPHDVQEAISEENVRSLLQRKTLHVHNQPFEIRDDGVIGTTSVRIGSNQSTRMLRVYDKRGPVRLEFQSRAERADLVARDVLIKLPKLWIDKAIGHLRDYVDFVEKETEKLLPWWDTFIHNQDRAMKTISDARIIELRRMIAWVDKQVSPTLSVLADVVGEQSIDAFVVSGRKRRGNKFNALLSAIKDKGR
jgi:DNA relaxase NicK